MYSSYLIVSSASSVLRAKRVFFVTLIPLPNVALEPSKWSACGSTTRALVASPPRVCLGVDEDYVWGLCYGIVNRY